jgi:hypothetical protein
VKKEERIIPLFQKVASFLSENSYIFHDMFGGTGQRRQERL